MAYVVTGRTEHPSILSKLLREHLQQGLPDPFIPRRFHFVDRIPLSENGKTDARALQEMASRLDETGNDLEPNGISKEIASIWTDALGWGVTDHRARFFDVGGHSLALAQVQLGIRERLGIDLSLLDLFENPTIEATTALVARLRAGTGIVSGTKIRQEVVSSFTQIAVIGMSCRFPGASNVEQYWQNLKSGVESITRWVDAQGRIRAAATLPQIDMFDALTFGIPPREARMLDPQHRLFLECALEVFEDAGYDPARTRVPVGVYAGSGIGSYLINNLHPSVGFRPCRSFLETAEDLNVMIAGDKDYLPTRVSYRLGLNGPSVNVQTACSTSLVAIHLACQSLIAGECGMAVAGAASIVIPQSVGHRYEPDMLFSRDGYCRPFDIDASGTVFGNGVAAVLLKPLVDAVRDGDPIHAVILASSINNDGGEKLGFSAPSAAGQEAVIAAALQKSGLAPDDIDYVECHGTATALGDAVEIEALSRLRTGSRKTCYVGSVKGNIGHLGWLPEWPASLKPYSA